MRSDGVVVTPPALDHDAGFVQRVEDFAVEQFVAQTRVEALDEAVLPRAARRNVGGLRADRRDPFLDGLRHELRAVVRANIGWNAAQDEQVRQNVDDVGGLELAIDPDRQAFVRELVDDVQHPILPALMRAVLDEVVGPHMVRPLGAQTDAGSVVEPEPTPLRLFPRDLQPLASPDPLDPLVADRPARCRSQKLSDLPVAVATVLTGKFDDVGRQLLFVLPPRRDAALRRTVLSKHPADPALGHIQAASNIIDGRTATRGAQ